MDQISNRIMEPRGYNGWCNKVQQISDYLLDQRLRLDDAVIAQLEGVPAGAAAVGELFQLDRSLTLVVSEVPHADKTRNRIEEPAHAGGFGAVRARLYHSLQSC